MNRLILIQIDAAAHKVPYPEPETLWALSVAEVPEEDSAAADEAAIEEARAEETGEV